MTPGQFDKRAEMEARKTLRSKSASKAEKEAAAAELALALAGDSSRSDPGGSEPGAPPLAKGASRAAKRAASSGLAHRRGGGRGR